MSQSSESGVQGSWLGETAASVAVSHSFADKSRFVDEAYEEYCRRTDAGEEIDPDAFCREFPGLENSLARLLQAHRFLEENPELAEEEESICWPEAGAAFLHYQLVLELGRGAFARVFLARDTRLGDRLVAIKIARQGGAAEAEILGRINHSNIVPVYSTQRDAPTGLTVVCMPYLGSTTLLDILDSISAAKGLPADARGILEAAGNTAHPVEPSAYAATPPALLARGAYADGIRWLGAQLADALAYIHDRGIVHLDLKPSNILLNPVGVPMLLDFNLSAQEGHGDLGPGGTLPYMAPEQLRRVLGGGDQARVGAAADLFSLGVILYELTTGAHPFGPVPLKAGTKELATQLLERQQRGFTPVRQHNANIDRALAQWIEKCLAFDAAARPQTAAHLASALRAQMRPAARTRRWLGRNPGKVAAGLILALAVSFAGAAGASLLPSASERHYAAGVELASQGQYADAIKQFNAAVVADPAFADAYFARARMYQKLGSKHIGNYNLAISDYSEAESLKPDGRNHAGIAFCLQCLDGHGAAFISYQRAVKASVSNAAIYANMGFCLQRTSRSKEAVQYLDLAIKADPDLQAALFSRTILNLEKIKNHGSILETLAKQPGGVKYFPPAEQERMRREVAEATDVGIKDLRHLLELGPPSGELSYIAACFMTTLSRTDPAWKEPALEHIARAIKNQGFDRVQAKTDLGLRPLQAEPAFQTLVATAWPVRPYEHVPRFIDPLPDANP